MVAVSPNQIIIILKKQPSDPWKEAWCLVLVVCDVVMLGLSVNQTMMMMMMKMKMILCSKINAAVFRKMVYVRTVC